MIRYIKIGKRTQEHKDVLESKGYEVSLEDGVLAIQASGLVEGKVDLSTPEKAQTVLSELIANRQVFSYETKFIFPDGKVLHGIFACTRLGKASALITKGAGKKTKGANMMSSIFDTL